MRQSTRRVFLGNVGDCMLLASLGPALAEAIGLGQDPAPAASGRDLERLVGLIMDTPLDKLQAKVAAALENGTSLRDVVGAAALANARTFGGTDYDGYHAFMALEPALTMGCRLPERQRPLPVLKVLYRTKAHMLRLGKSRRLGEVEAAKAPATANALRECVLDCDMRGAEAVFKKIHDTKGLDRAYDDLQKIVQVEIDVHQTVLAWRAYDMLSIAGKNHGWELLRQEVRHCVDREQGRVKRNRPEPAVRRHIPKILAEHELLETEPGNKRPDDARVAELANIVMRSGRRDAAEQCAAALASGWDPEVVGEAISVAASDYTLHQKPNPRKRNGVHGAGTGVHAADTANAWRNIARVSPNSTKMTSLVVAAYHTAGQFHQVAPERTPYEDRARQIRQDAPKELLGLLDGFIRDRDLLGACAAMHKYCEQGGAHEPALDLCMHHAIENDGALHAEKYFKQILEELPRVRKAFRARRLVALARVTASLAGEPAPGLAEAKRLLG